MTDRDRYLSHLHGIQICSSLKMVAVAYPQGQIGRALKLTTRLYLMLRCGGNPFTPSGRRVSIRREANFTDFYVQVQKLL